jgi:hypothetical protein
MVTDLKAMLDYLRRQGADEVAHTQKTYMSHLANLYRLMEACGCDAELCAAGVFHSVYGTEVFRFKLLVDCRQQIRELIGERAERLAYWNCFVDRASLDWAVEQGTAPHTIRHRETGEKVALSGSDFADLCRVHLYDWLEQAPRSQRGWGYRRAAYRRMAERLGGPAWRCYESVFAQEPIAAE